MRHAGEENGKTAEEPLALELLPSEALLRRELRGAPAQRGPVLLAPNARWRRLFLPPALRLRHVSSHGVPGARERGRPYLLEQLRWPEEQVHVDGHRRRGQVFLHPEQNQGLVLPQRRSPASPDRLWARLVGFMYHVEEPVCRFGLE